MLEIRDFWKLGTFYCITGLKEFWCEEQIPRPFEGKYLYKQNVFDLDPAKRNEPRIFGEKKFWQFSAIRNFFLFMEFPHCVD